MVTPGILSSKIRKAARIARLISNFPQVYSHLVVKSSLDEIRLRNGIRISAGNDVDLWRLFHDIWLFEVYTRDHRSIQPGSAVIDIGASVGVFSVFAGAMGGRVHSYEPDPVSFQNLLRNIRYNPDLQIRPLHYALAGSRDMRVLHQYGKSTGNSLYERPRKAEEKVREVMVECRTLADTLEENSIEKCDFLKLNCEGAEFEILFSTPEDCFSKIDTLAIEVHNQLTRHTHLDLMNHLDSLGYSTSISLSRKDSTVVLLARRI